MRGFILFIRTNSHHTILPNGVAELFWRNVNTKITPVVAGIENRVCKTAYFCMGEGRWWGQRRLL